MFGVSFLGVFVSVMKLMIGYFVNVVGFVELVVMIFSL